VAPFSWRGVRSLNVILILIDTLRRDSLGCYGNPWIQTPNMDRLAARSAVFEQAYIGSYPCMPARRDLWTGRLEFPFRGWGPLEPADTDIGSLVKAAGKTAMLITDHYHLWEKGSGNYHFAFSGVEFIRGQENDAWVTAPGEVCYPAAPEKLAKHARPGSWERYARNTAHFKVEADYFAPQVFQSSVDWLEANQAHEDFLLVLDCFDPHEPFDPPAPYRDMYAHGTPPERVVWPTYGYNQLSPAELEDVKALYAGEVTLVDHWLGRLLDKVTALGLDENTAIVLCTDHGHMFGEHGIIGKPWSALSDSNLYQDLAHIPLMIAGPGIEAQRVPGLVQLLDLFPTMCELLGVSVPPGTHGQSLLPVLMRGAAPQRSVALYGRFGEAVNITDGEWTLFLWPQDHLNQPLYWYSTQPPVYGKLKVIGGLELSPFGPRYPVAVARGGMQSALYHVAMDPSQAHDLYDQEPAQVARLVEALKAYLEGIGAPREISARLGI